MSKATLNSTRQPDVHTQRGPVRGLASLALLFALIGASFGGCSQEQRDNWTWNPFEKKTKATPPDAGTKARPPASATASNQPRPAAKSSPDDAKAEQVNRDVDDYARNFPADRTPPNRRATDSRTPVIDDDEQLADASPSATRAQRTAARPAPARTSTSPREDRSPAPTTNSPTTAARSTPAAAPPGDSGSELTLLPMGSSGSSSTVYSTPAPQATEPTHTATQEPPSHSNYDAASASVQHPISDPPEPTRIAMTNRGASEPASGNMSDSSHISADEEDIDEPISRPPVLGSIQIEAGSDAGSSVGGSAGAVEMDDAPPARTTPAPITPEPIKPIASTPRTDPKPILVKESPKPEPRDVTPFEDKDSGSIEMTVDAEPARPAATPITPPVRETIKPAVQPIAPPPPTPTPTPVPTANPSKPPLDGTARQIADLEAVVARQPNNIDQQLKLRMAYLLDGDEARAIAPTPGMSEDVERTVIAQIKSVIAAKSSEGRDAPAAANSQLESAETIRASASEKADLQVPRVVLCTAIRAFGDYAPIDPPIFTAGSKKNKVLVYIEVDNFVSKQMPDGQYKTELSLRESLLDARGRELWSKQTPRIEDINRQPRRDFFVSTGARAIPASLPPGEYYYKVEIEDVQANKINSGKTQFRLVSVGKS